MGIFRERFSNFLGNPSCNVLAFDFTLILTHLYIFIVVDILAHAKALVFSFSAKFSSSFCARACNFRFPVFVVKLFIFLCNNFCARKRKRRFMKIREQRWHHFNCFIVFKRNQKTRKWEINRPRPHIKIKVIYFTNHPKILIHVDCRWWPKTSF